ncbi:MAG TPA: VOC family protein, partial [Puia sp.]|nr:VOC family protein [Puia sp.]
GGELALQKISESPMAAQMSSEEGALILHSSLTLAGTLLMMASDMIGAGVRPGNPVALCLHCASDEEIHMFFKRLSVGGQVKMPLHQGFWGATYGELTDKYGMIWMFNYTRK